MTKRVTSLLLAILLVCAMVIPVSASSFDPEVRQSIAPIAIWTDVNGVGSIYGHGTCFFIGSTKENPQYLVTNHHVVETFLELGAGDTLYLTQSDGSGEEVVAASMKVSMRVYFDDNDYVEAYVVDADDKADIAILRLEKPTEKRKALALQVPTDDMIGSTVYAVGYPSISDNALLDPVSQWSAEDATVTTGSINRLATQSGTGAKQIQIDANISGGNSGGPLVTSEGYAVGVNTWSATRTTDGEQVHYAVNIAEVIAMCDANAIAYELAGEGSGALLWVLVGAAIVAVVVVILLMQRKKKQPAPAAVPTPAPAAEEALRFQGTSGVFAGKRFSIDGTVRIGRDPARNDLVYPNNTHGVSGAHCMLMKRDGTLYIQDLGSTYGTFLNGSQRLPANQPIALKVGDRFALGSDKECFTITRKGGL